MSTHAFPSQGGVGTTSRESPARRGLCTVVCGSLAVATCLQILAAAVAVSVGLVMVTIAVAGSAAPWVGVAAAVGVGITGACLWRNRHRR